MLKAFSVSVRTRPRMLEVFSPSSRRRLVKLKVFSASNRRRPFKLKVLSTLCRGRLVKPEVFSASSQRRPVKLKVFSAPRRSAPHPGGRLRVQEVGSTSRVSAPRPGGDASSGGDAAHPPPSLHDRVLRGGGSRKAKDHFLFQHVEHLYSLTTSRVHFTPITHQHPSCHGRVWESASPATLNLPLSPSISRHNHVLITCQPNASHVPTSRPPLTQQSRGSRRATMPAFCRTVSLMCPTFSKRGACLPGLGRCRPRTHKETFTKKIYRSWESLLENRAFVRLLYGARPTDAAGLASFGWDLSPPCQRR